MYQYLLQNSLVLVFLLASNAYCYEIKDFFQEKGYADNANINVQNVIREYDLDPLYMNITQGKISELKYKLRDVYLHHLKQCRVTQLLLNQNEHTFVERWDCPYFLLNFNYELDGAFADVDLFNQKGFMQINTGNFKLTLTGSHMEVTRNNRHYDVIGNPKIKATATQYVAVEYDVVNQVDQITANEFCANFNGKDQRIAKQFVENLLERLLLKCYYSLKDYLYNHPITRYN